MDNGPNPISLNGEWASGKRSDANVIIMDVGENISEISENISESISDDISETISESISEV